MSSPGHVDVLLFRQQKSTPMRITVEDAATLRSGCTELFLLEPGDVSPAYVGWLSDPCVVKFLEVRFDRRDQAAVEKFVHGCQQSPTSLLLGIRNRTLGLHIGNIKLCWNPNHGVGDIGVMIGETKFWSQGHAAQAVSLLSRFALDRIRLRKLVAGIYRSNSASIRAFEKSGYSLESVLREQALLDGKPEDVLLFSLHSKSRPQIDLIRERETFEAMQ